MSPLQDRYHLNLGEQHWPEGRTVDRDGKQIRLRPQLHIVAYPKSDGVHDWSRVEVLLDGESFLPRAIRLLDPAGTIETVYVFDRTSMTVNDSESSSENPFNQRPPRDFSRVQ